MSRCDLQRNPFLLCESHISSEEFKGSILEAMQETRIQRTKGGLDGELHEKTTFKALQLSSNIEWTSGTTVRELVEYLHESTRA